MTPPLSAHCPQCGAAIPEASEHGLCPRCVFAKAMQPTADPGTTTPAPPELDTVRAAFPSLEVFALIGRGGMGSVFKARQPQLDRYVALKILPTSLAEQPGFSERFQKEAQALARLSHPHIVTVHDFGQAGGFYYLLMEFVDGVNLRQLLQAKRLTPKEALSIVPPVCDALQCAHDHGIVHRDIKPENLLMDKAGVVKIADFGIAKIVGATTSASTAEEPVSAGGRASLPVGTPDYAAPEQARGAADHRADIYSLGVVLYEMLTGERPTEAIVAPSKRVQVDIRIDEIVLRALEKVPELRFATAAEFRTQVETIVDGPPQLTPTPNTGLLKSERGRITWDDAPGVPMRQPAIGDVALHGDRLILSLGAERREVPLKDVRSVREAVPPGWWSPSGHSYAAIEYDNGGPLRRVAFLPGTAPFRTVGDTQHHVAEWLAALQGPIQQATGRPIALSPGRLRLPMAMSPAGFLWLFPVVLWGVWLLSILWPRRAGSGFPIEIVFPLTVLMALLAIRFGSRRIRPLATALPGDHTAKAPVRFRGTIMATLLATLFLIVPLTWPMTRTFIQRSVISVRGNVTTPGTESVQVLTDQAIVRQARHNLEGMVITFGPTGHRWAPPGVYLEAMFDVTLDPHWADAGATWVIKPRHGIHSGYRLDGPPGAMLGKIVLRPGTPAREADGAYVIGEFRPENGETLPLAVRLNGTP